MNTHLQSLEFINSAGAWDQKSKRFLFSAVEKGRPVLSILNIESGDIERELIQKSEKFLILPGRLTADI